MLTEKQREILEKFYSCDAARVVYNKNERKAFWDAMKARSDDIDDVLIERKCPALAHQIRRSRENNANIQSAVFSECAYAQTLANMLELRDYSDRTMEDLARFQPTLSAQNMVPRYYYWNEENALIQAGGRNGVDCILINIPTRKFYMIEFKEPGAKTSEPDLPRYHEDGKLLVTPEFLAKYPQFQNMLEEQRGLNFFEAMGNNIHNFSAESVEVAVTGNYDRASKAADVICTEDEDGYLVMIPSNQVAQWAEIEGEIRPAGRNHHNVWTPVALGRFLTQLGATITEGYATIAKDCLEPRRERGGGGRVSGYKINPLFYVPIGSCTERDGQISFDLRRVQQLNPTIAGKMFFKNLSYTEVKEFYTE